jgi:hypothetical protein
MVRTRFAAVPGRWILAGLAAHALAAGLFLTNTLSSNPSEAPTEPPELAASLDTAAPDPARTEPAPETARTSDPAAGRESAPEARAEAALEARVRSTTAALVQTFAAQAYADEGWLAEVREQAHALGAEAVPALEAVLADDSRSVEEHVVASELLAALPPR